MDCGGRYSMPSSHAANHMGLAAFWYGSIAVITGRKWTWLWYWALAIGYAQIYVGKHYPFDVLAGSLLGYIIGTLLAKLFEMGWNYPGSFRSSAVFRRSPSSDGLSSADLPQ